MILNPIWLCVIHERNQINPEGRQYGREGNPGTTRRRASAQAADSNTRIL
jgi:hypothetical protein